VREDLIIHRNW